jgi:hypothetical protein
MTAGLDVAPEAGSVRGVLRDARPHVDAKYFLDKFVLAEVDINARDRRPDLSGRLSRSAGYERPSGS